MYKLQHKYITALLSSFSSFASDLSILMMNETTSQRQQIHLAMNIMADGGDPQLTMMWAWLFCILKEFCLSQR